jgi:hypothetical protein
MAVAFRTAVVHDSRRDAWRLVVKSVKISNGCIVLQSYFKKYKKNLKTHRKSEFAGKHSLLLL